MTNVTYCAVLAKAVKAFQNSKEDMLHGRRKDK